MKNKLILTLLFCCGAMGLCAQNSMTFSYPDLAVNKTLICANSGTGHDLVYYNDTNTRAPCFFYHIHANGTTRRFERLPIVGGNTPFPHNNIDTVFVVKDMVIGSGYCYFCGLIHIHTVWETPIVDPLDRSREYIDTCFGFLGRFPMNEITDMSNHLINAKYVIIPITKSLKRLKIESGARRLTAVALNHLGDNGFILLDDIGTAIQYQCLYPQDADENITDIAYTTTSLVTVSEFRNDDNRFAIRNGNIASAYGAPWNLSYFNIRYDFNTSGLNTVTLPRPFPPTAEYTHDIRITEIPETEKVVVAYEGVGGGFDISCESDNYNTNVYKLDLQVVNPAMSVQPTMEDAQVVSLDKVYAKGLQGIKYLPYDATVALLYKNTGNTYGPAGQIQYPTLSSYGQKNYQTIDILTLPSMDSYGYGELHLIGWNTASLHPTHFFQDIQNLTPSCFPVLPKCYTEELRTTEASVDISGMTQKLGFVEWSDIQLEEKSMTNKRPCNAQ